jgi:hypothetical protein
MNYIRCLNQTQGKINETKVLTYLNRKNDPEDYWVDNNEKNDREVIDFKHSEKKIKIELKSRNFNYRDFPDWQVGLNKIREMTLNPEYTYFIFFLFYDGLYYWKYNLPNLINHCSCKEGGTMKRGENEITDNVFIKREHLELITKEVLNEPLEEDEDEGCLL